jgi:aerobic carbon-monoxide dehydrogenase medium subunit
MKPPAFQYHAPETIEQVIALLSSLENSRLLAGGQSLMPMLNMRYALPDHIIDLNRVPGLASIAVTGSHLLIGAMTRQRDIEFSADIERTCPIISEAIRHVGHRQTRNRGTIGGSLCHLDPSAELVTLCALLDATVSAIGPNGTRDIPFKEFPQGYMTSALQPDECLTRVSLPLWPAGHGYGFVEFARRHGDFAIVSAAVLLELDASANIRRAAIALGGVGYAPLRVTAIETGIIGKAPGAELFAEASKACSTIEALDDVHASSAYRRRLAVTMAKRALQAAGDRALANIKRH